MEGESEQLSPEASWLIRRYCAVAVSTKAAFLGGVYDLDDVVNQVVVEMLQESKKRGVVFHFQNVFDDTSVERMMLKRIVDTVTTRIRRNCIRENRITNSIEVRRKHVLAASSGFSINLIESVEPLSDDEKRIVIMRFVQGCTLAEIAEHESISISLVHRKLKNAILQLARILGVDNETSKPKA
jgi:RNA polymerase sigma factor (sigma-70 family)